MPRGRAAARLLAPVRGPVRSDRPGAAAISAGHTGELLPQAPGPEREGVSLRFSFEGEPLGTAGGLRLVTDHRAALFRPHR